MKIYLVGGAVRDQLLGLPVKEHDYVVVGATVDDMLRLGFKQVGKDFPVFLHPETKEEYALARVERKIGKGYTGFAFDSSPHVTLEEDLLRRDLTINAMAQTETGEVIDPYQGEVDLKNRMLRHVSKAFVEDPVRILRVGRFAARFSGLGFHVASDTTELMREMVEAGEVDALQPERVWKEFQRALSEPHPDAFFIVLQSCGAREKLFPEITENCLFPLRRAVSLSPDPVIRFAALLSPLSLPDRKRFAERYRIPAEYAEFASLLQPLPEDCLAFLYSVDAFRREERFQKLLIASLASFENFPAEWLQACFDAAKKVEVKEIVREGLQGKAISEALMKKRKDVITKLIQSKSMQSKS